MRSILLPVLLCAVSSSAATLDVGGDLTFTLADPAQEAQVKGSGEVSLTCSPCSNPDNTKKFMFGSIRFVYQSAPAESPNRVGSGLYAGVRESRWSYEVTNLFPPGARLYPILQGALCVCGNGADASKATDFPKPALAFTTDPKMLPLTYFGSAALEVPTVGVTRPLSAQCTANPKQGERATIEVHGPGIDLRHTFDDSKDGQLTADITPTAPGTIEAWCTFEPYGNRSKVVTMPVVEPADRAPENPSKRSDRDADETPEGGCSVTGAPAMMLLAALALRRRR